MMFDLDQFISDLRASATERSRQALREVVARAIAAPSEIMQGLGEPTQGGAQVLYRGSDLTVLNVTWVPNQVTLPHDHRMAAVIGMYSGREDNVFWRRIPNPTRFQIEAAGGEALGVGDATILGRDIIHSVINPLGRLSAAIHVYDGDFFAAERSMWDPETLEEAPYDLAAVSKGMAMAPVRANG